MLRLGRFSQRLPHLRATPSSTLRPTLPQPNHAPPRVHPLRSPNPVISRHVSSSSAHDRISRKTFLYLAGAAVGMLGLSYAAVPLYRRFCQQTGYGGTVQRKESVEEKIARHSKAGTKALRELTVQFNADVADGMPWKFIPTQREVDF